MRPRMSCASSIVSWNLQLEPHYVSNSQLEAEAGAGLDLARLGVDTGCLLGPVTFITNSMNNNFCTLCDVTC